MDPQAIVPLPLAPRNELARRYERARRLATDALESLIYGSGETQARAEDVVDAFEMATMWRLVVGGDVRPTSSTWALMQEATKP